MVYVIGPELVTDVDAEDIATVGRVLSTLKVAEVALASAVFPELSIAVPARSLIAMVPLPVSELSVTVRVTDPEPVIEATALAVPVVINCTSAATKEIVAASA